jgi:hypothetical protein
MTDFVISRVVIACDAVGDNASGIELAATMATACNAALHGIFVQDEGLLNLAALPFGRQVMASGEVTRHLDESAVVSHFTAHADRMRAALEAAAHEHAVACSFAVVQGYPTLETLPMEDRDLLVIEAESQPFAGTFRLDSRLLEASFEAHRPVLLVRSTGRRSGDVVALVQRAGSSAERVISAAAGIAQSGDYRLTVLLPGEGVEATEAAGILRRISARLAARSQVEHASLHGLLLQGIAREGSVLVVDADAAINDAGALKELAARTRANILFLR